MLIRTKSRLSDEVIREGVIKPNTVYKVIGVSLNGRVDVNNRSHYYVGPDYYTIVGFKDYVNLCLK